MATIARKKPQSKPAIRKRIREQKDLEVGVDRFFREQAELERGLGGLRKLAQPFAVETAPDLEDERGHVGQKFTRNSTP